MMKWLEKTGSPQSRIDSCNFSNDRIVEKLDYEEFTIRRKKKWRGVTKTSHLTQTMCTHWEQDQMLHFVQHRVWFEAGWIMNLIVNVLGSTLTFVLQLFSQNKVSGFCTLVTRVLECLKFPLIVRFSVLNFWNNWLLSVHSEPSRGNLSKYYISRRMMSRDWQVRA